MLGNVTMKHENKKKGWLKTLIMKLVENSRNEMSFILQIVPKMLYLSMNFGLHYITTHPIIGYQTLFKF